jgi:putative transposase
MHQSIRLKLKTDIQQTAALLKTMERYNEMCNDVAPVAFQIGTANIRDISDAMYWRLRQKYKVPSQMAVRAIARAAGRYAEAKCRVPSFDPLDKIVFDNKLLTFKHLDEVSIMTVDGRISVPITVIGYEKPERERPRGYLELEYMDHEFYMDTYVKSAENNQ